MTDLTPYLTPEVIEQAAKASYEDWLDDVGREDYPSWEMLDALSRSRWDSTTRAAAPVLLAPAEREIERLKAERDGAVNERVGTLELLASSERGAASLLAASEAREAKLREALKEYGQHASGCQLRWHDRPDGIVANLVCDCGLRAALLPGRTP